MLGRRKLQRDLFEAANWPHRVAEDSIYARMAAVRDVLFSDDDLARMYCLDNGRPSLPPSLMCGVLLLQFHDGVGDDEAVERLRYDLRWKVALGLPLDYPGFDPTSLVVFRKRLLKHGEERYAFDRFLKVAREAGFLPEKIRQLQDTMAMKGAGAAQDTYTLLRKGIRRLLRAMGFAVPEKRRGLQVNLQRYLDSDKKAAIDWADPQARAKELGVLVRDADAALELASCQADDDEVRSTGWMLTKILGDDVVVGEDGAAKLGEGVARDRMVSWTDPEMRHGRKSASSRWNGDKVQVAEEPETELIVGVDIVEANAGDGVGLLPMVDRVEEHAEVKVDGVTGDTAYGGAENRVGCAEREIDLVSPMGRPRDPEVDKSAFAIEVNEHEVNEAVVSEAVARVICPQGHTTTDYREVKDEAGRPVKQFVFGRQVCAGCALFERCVKGKVTGRTVTLHYHEDVVRAARARQETVEFKELYRVRPKVERKIAELVEHGLRQARYIGRKKKRLQALWTAAVVNLKRLFKLAKGETARLAGALTKISAGSSLVAMPRGA
jgi:transposase